MKKLCDVHSLCFLFLLSRSRSKNCLINKVCSLILHPLTLNRSAWYWWRTGEQHRHHRGKLWHICEKKHDHAPGNNNKNKMLKALQLHFSKISSTWTTKGLMTTDLNVYYTVLINLLVKQVMVLTLLIQLFLF